MLHPGAFFVMFHVKHPGLSKRTAFRPRHRFGFGAACVAGADSNIDLPYVNDGSTADCVQDVLFLPQCCVSAWLAPHPRAVSPGRVLSVGLGPSGNATLRDKMHGKGLVRRRTETDMVLPSCAEAPKIDKMLPPRTPSGVRDRAASVREITRLDKPYASASFRSTLVERKEQCSQMMQGTLMASQGTTASSSSSVAPRCAR